jgi:hypothetical protein
MCDTLRRSEAALPMREASRLDHRFRKPTGLISSRRDQTGITVLRHLCLAHQEHRLEGEALCGGGALFEAHAIGNSMQRHGCVN